MKLRSYILLAATIIGLSIPALGQDYYDDIYGSPKKEKTKPQKQQKPSYEPADFAAADTYAPTGTSTRDVDEYNRRGQFLVSDSIAADSLELGDTFAYTRRIERYHNPEIVTESGDTTLCDYYYSTPVTNVNIYVDNSLPYYYPYSWSWRYGNPWYWNVYGPAYIGWGGPLWSWYDPFWDPYPWGWGWSWGWSWGGPGWGPGWGPAYGPGWGNHHAWHPSSSGSYLPHRPTTGNGSSANRGGSTIGSGFTGTRPGNMGRPSYNTTTTPNNGVTTRPVSAARPGTRPSQSQGSYTPYGAGTRGRGSSSVNSNSSTTRNRVNSSNSNSSRSSYNSGSSRSSYSGGGSHSTRGGGGSYGGGGSHGGGGGGRGRR